MNAVQILDKIYQQKSSQKLDNAKNLDGFFIQVYATATHNTAVEYEFLKQFPESLIYYEKAVKLAQMHLSTEQQQMFIQRFEQAKRNVSINV